MSGRTKLQSEKLNLMRQLLDQVRIGYLGNSREHAALNHIRDALDVLHDPIVINSSDPEDEPAMLEAFVEKKGSKNMVVVLADADMTDENLLQVLIRFANILHADLQNGQRAKMKSEASKQFKQALLTDRDQNSKILNFPVIKRPRV